MNFESLNDMVTYIEEHLTEDINYKKLAKIVGISDYSLQRIFVFLTGISIAEYIRKRRLSKSFEELRNSDIKIIDLAIKYNYESSISFSRAFKKYFGMTPSECRKKKTKYKLFPIYEFHDGNNYNDISYEIKELTEKKVYAFGVSASTQEDLLFKIRHLYKKIRKNGIRDIFDKYGMYGISLYENGLHKYYVGSKIKLPDTEEIKIENGKYAIFEINFKEQKDITRLYEFVYTKWIKSTDNKILDKPAIEFYENDKCYIHFMLKDKQN